MADLSAIEIQQQTFREVFRGYDRYEIEQFLEDVVKAVRAKEGTIRQQTERIAELEAELNASQEAEEAIKRTFVAAQRTSQEMVAEAQDRANQLLSESQAESDKIRRQASEESERMLTSSIEEAERVKAEASTMADKVEQEVDAKYAALSAEREAEQQQLAQRLIQLRTAVSDMQERMKTFAGVSSGELDGLAAAIDLETHSIADILEKADSSTLEGVDGPDTGELEAIEAEMETVDAEGGPPRAVYLQQPRGLRPWERHRGYRGGVR